MGALKALGVYALMLIGIAVVVFATLDYYGIKDKQGCELPAQAQVEAPAKAE